MAKVKVDKKKCIGCGSCVSICPGNFSLSGGKSSVKNSSPAKITCEKKAASSCPVDAISVQE
ncbi:ferredoxin [Candidatus Pacearchaeota archaeon]|nr:ferredoxin [Candidatus Pacearchaeota archaeon]